MSIYLVVAFYHCFSIDNNVNISSSCSKTVHTKFTKPLSFQEAILAHQFEAKIFTSSQFGSALSPMQLIHYEQPPYRTLHDVH